jgi:cytochrome P450
MSWFKSGADNTILQSTALAESFLALMIVFPEVQRKAQMELDAVLSQERFPTAQDRPRLPYLEAVLKEVIRFRPIIPLMPHSTNFDDEYRGYTIPKGSWIMANTW